MYPSGELTSHQIGVTAEVGSDPSARERDLVSPVLGDPGRGVQGDCVPDDLRPGRRQAVGAEQDHGGLGAVHLEPASPVRLDGEAYVMQDATQEEQLVVVAFTCGETSCCRGDAGE
jgi:hypothetical protein